MRHWTVSDGIPTPVEDVAQTPDGYLWMATGEGLFRFDGVQFAPFTTETTPVFRGDSFLSLTVTPSGELWAGTKDRWAYRLRQGTWTAYSLDDAFEGEHWVQGFAEDANGTIWAASTGPVLARLEGERFVRHTDALDLSWPHFAVDASGTIWTKLFAERAPGVTEAYLGGDVVVRMLERRLEPVYDDRLLGFSASQYGPILHRAYGSREALARGERGRVDLTDATGRLLTWIWFDAQTARAMLVDRAGRAWVQTEDVEGQNELVLVKDGQVLARFAPEGATWFEGVFEDRQGAYWTYSAGTGLIQIAEDPFQSYTTDDGVPRYAARVSPTGKGGVIVSTLGQANEVRAATIEDGRVTTHTFRATPNREAFAEWTVSGSLALGQLIEDRSGQRWGVAGTHLFRVDGANAEHVTTTGQMRLRDLAPDPAETNAMWAADIHGTIVRINTDAGAVTDSLQLPDPTEGRQPLLVWDLHHTATGRFLAATSIGLYEIISGSKLQPVEAFAGRPVYSIHEEEDGTLWMPTGVGLVRVQAGEVASIGRAEGLPADAFAAVILDDDGHVWLPQGPRLHRVSRSQIEAAIDGRAPKLDVVTLLPVDGVLPTAATIWGHTVDAAGRIWLPSPNGAQRIDPLLYARQHARPLEPILERVATESGAVFAFTEDLRLPLGARTLTFSYTAVDVLAPRHVRFRTRLAGHDADWVDRGSARTAVVGGLDPGRYVWQVQAMNAGGVWSAPVETASFVVPAQFWETGWFAVLGVLALGLTLMGAYRVRVRHLRVRAEALETTVEERTAELRAEKQKTEAQAEQLRALDEAKSRFFANVSHEFRTPLTLSLGPLEDLRAGLHGSLSPSALRHIDLATRNNRRLLRLVNQLLEVARVESGVVKLNRGVGDLGDYVRVLAQPFVGAAERRGVAYTVTIPAQPVWVRFDPEHLDKVVANLLSNAIKFTPSGGAVRLRVDVSGTDAEVTVSDTGPGIAPELRATLFDRFVQGQQSELQPGTGIGLSLAKELTDLHGGTLVVESEVGQGSTFTLRLPLAEAVGRGEPTGPGQIVADVSASPEREAPTPAVFPEAVEVPDQTTVLVVDDHADIRAYLRSHLERHGPYRVLEAEDGEAALALVRARLPDLIVSDVMMPRRDGFSLLEALRTDPETDFLPILLLTARAEAEDRLAGLGLGADDYLTKPFDARELTARVDNLIAQRRRLRVRFAASLRTEGVQRTLHPTITEVASADTVFLETVQAAIEAGMGDEVFGVEALTEAVGRSRSNLHKRLTELTGETPSALLRRMRLERGASLLEQGAGTVSEVAYAVGFKSVSHFSSSFSKLYGMTPTAYVATKVAAVPRPAE
ncbi:MAG: ATP-binding protein [Bacteroidota bacterium]